ncbi:MAG: hypothetical protein R2864_14835 [Syntrophotaleaceae bacterium]
MYLLVSALLGFMAVSGWLGRNNLARLQLDVQLPEEVYDGVETLIRVQLHNRQRWLAACLLSVRIQDGQAHTPLLVRQGRAAQSLATTFYGRGERSLPEVKVSSTFPIGFLSVPLRFFWIRTCSCFRGRAPLGWRRPLPPYRYRGAGQGPGV